MLTDEEIEKFCVGMMMGKSFQDRESQKEIRWMLDNDILYPSDKRRAELLYREDSE